MSALTTRTLDAGELLCDIGDPGDTAWVIVKGRIQATTEGPAGHETQLGLHGPGELIGESVLLDHGIRRARLRAARRSMVAVLDRAWLVELMASQPDAAMAVMTALLARNDRVPSQPSQVIAVIPLATTVMGEALAVADATSALGRHLTIDPDRHPSIHRAATNGELDWLDRIERNVADGPIDLEHDGPEPGVILLGKTDRPAWNLAATKVADRVLLIVDSADGPAIGGAERALLDAVPKSANSARLLVIVHPSDAERPQRTHEWLVRRNVDRHLHLRRHAPTDTNRVARHAAGKALTLAIGAGGVRSAGAVGTIQAMSERGLAVDAVAGVSGGAIVAAWLAVLGTVDRLEEKTEWSMRKLLDYTIPVGSIVAGGRAWRRIEEACGDRDVLDTWIPLAVTSTDLTDAVSVNHTSGRLADAIYASISIPGVFPPVDIDGHVHIDGAVFDAIPVDGGRCLVSEGPMVVVDLSPPSGKKTPPLPRVMSGRRLLVHRLLPGMKTQRVPNPLDTIMRSTTVASARRRVDALESVDCHVHLNLSAFTVLDFGKVDQVMSRGKSQSVPVIEQFITGPEAPSIDQALAAIGDVRSHRARRPSNADDQAERPSGAALLAALSLARSDLRLRARRFFVAIAATSVVLALLLLMTGVVNQLQREPEVAVDTFGGSTWIVPAGADGVFTSSATFPESIVDSVGPTPTPLGRVLVARFRLADATAERNIDIVLVGHADLPDGAPLLKTGRPASRDDEIVLSEDAGFAVGDRVRVGPLDATVTGVVAETTVFAGMPFVFVSLETARRLVVDGEPLLSALVTTEVPELPAALQSLPSALIADDALGPIERPIATMRLVQVLLAVVAALIVGAVVFLATLDRTRDIAVLRAMGVGSGPISIGVAAQAITIGLVAALIALVVQLALAPAFPLRVFIGSFDRLLLVAVSMLVAVASSYGAIRRTLRADPAAAFSGPGA